MKGTTVLSGVFVLILIVLLGGGCQGETAEVAAEPAGDGEAGVVEAEVTGSDDGGLGQKLESLLARVSPPQSYEVRSNPPGNEPAMTMVVKMGDKQPQKIKMVHDDGWMIVDFQASSTFAFEPEENIVMKLPAGAAGQGQAMAPGDYVDPDATTLGKEKVDGVMCWVVESKVGSLESKVWIGTKDGLPRQFETDEGVTRFVYSRINEVRDSEFELPSGIEVLDMAQMMQRGFRK